ncbi:hypothetical protein GCM10027275_54800 [Rhabdobacter roseus]|uniref:DUF2062 domain-containing protein n=1 Tax=Rhabdobacter roseus TaxID=1655419 RepID=A0A840TX34_9BACT|nr:DUF2062 domain-containing protein [Rhabdobacter roseus]MBB5287495.1 hypothetical protein [Rhabdobacter roseus]
MTRPWLQKRLKKWGTFLKQGTSIRQLAWSLTLSLLLGVFPLIGTANFIITLLAVRYKLNLPLMLAISYALYPVQILLWVPFLRVGEGVLGLPAFPITWEQLRASFDLGIGFALNHFGLAMLCATLGWLLLSGVVMMGFYHVFKFILQRLLPIQRKKEQLEAQTTSADLDA